MKSLDQIEARTDLNKLTGDATAVCVIAGPGSYYLTADLAGATGKDTIRVATAGRVTIDLNGFALTITGSGKNAILLQTANDAVVIRNGTILSSGATAVGGAGNRVTCDGIAVIGNGGVAFALGTDATVTHCRIAEGGINAGPRSVVRDSVLAGTSDVDLTLGTDAQAIGVRFTLGRGALTVGDRSLVADCQISATGAQTLFGLGGNVIQTGAGCTVRRCSVSAGNIAGNGIGVGGGSLVESCHVLSAFREGIQSNTIANVTVVNCSVQGNGRDGMRLGANARVSTCTVQGSSLNGISVGENSAITGCAVTGTGTSGGAAIVSTAENVSVARCVIKGHLAGPGISVVSGSVTDCDVSLTNGGAGIAVTSKARVTHNQVHGGNGAGIQVLAGAGDNRIESNQVTNNVRGIDVDSAGNLIISNSASGNTTANYDIVADNRYGQIIDLTAAGTAAVVGNSSAAVNPVGTTNAWANFAY
jgi:parallel beta-helix repeat protein